jgi:hypothetical protein
MKALLLTLICAAPAAVFAADEGRVSFLEQEVRNLQRQVQVLSRRLDQLDSRPARSAPRPTTGRTTAPADDPAPWVDARKWQQLRPGMSELDVIGQLGPPTSMREEDGARVLYYALEIGASGFLGGSVTLKDRVVSEVRRPELQ